MFAGFHFPPLLDSPLLLGAIDKRADGIILWKCQIGVRQSSLQDQGKIKLRSGWGSVNGTLVLWGEMGVG
jgi:hypothetical protein